ncbi:MAG: DUF1232 domain-containing protein [Terrisporobacter sp.]|uniref:YkvA family protein n=1 Tax=Terrisporobacter sp. TaxID=1965305 RepID=UPI002FCBBAA5
MNKATNTGNRLLDSLKRVLVRFREAGYGVKFIKNLPKLADYLTDRHVSIIGRFKVFFSIVATLIYFVFSIDIIPEILFGPLGFFDDAFLLIWAIGNINEELEKYKGPQDDGIKSDKKVYKDPNIIDDARFKIRDED